VARLLEAEGWPEPGWWEAPPRTALERRWHALARTPRPGASLLEEAAELEIHQACRGLLYRLIDEGLGTLTDRVLRTRLGDEFADMLAILDLDAELRRSASSRALSRCLEALSKARCDGWTAEVLASVLARAGAPPDDRSRRALRSLPFIGARFYAQGPRAGDPPWIDELSVHEGDAEHRLVAAALRGNDGGVLAAIPELSGAPPCPRATRRLALPAAEALSGALVGRLGRGREAASGRALGWCAALDVLDDGPFEAWCGALVAAPLDDAAALALLSMARRNRARYAALIGALGIDGGWLTELATQLEGEAQALHAELARLAALVDGPS
jgi:hypothetical protein